MRSMIGKFEKYLDKKRLDLNTKKTKIMRFRKGDGRMRKNWRWKGKEIEKVYDYRYLGYVMRRNGKQEAQVKDRVKRAAAVMG